MAVDALSKAKLPFVAVLSDPTYGGVSASYAMQADVRIAVAGARIGFAGPQVILNTMCEANQEKFDRECPPDFQSAEYVLSKGQLDIVVEDSEKLGIQKVVEQKVGTIFGLLMKPNQTGGEVVSTFLQKDLSNPLIIPTPEEMQAPFNYTNSRKITRPQTQDIISNVFSGFVELVGDGRVGRDACIRGGIASFQGVSCVVIGTFKGHTPQTMQDANYGMASPHGYRTALRLMRMAERFGMPVVTLVDTVGAWPTFDCERDGQSEAIATNLTVMGGLTVPIITLLVGEGGSGGALGIGMGNAVGMLSGGYFGVISPEGAASILGRYKDDAHKAKQFPSDCQELAVAQCIYANQLKAIGVVDEIIWESQSENGETFDNFPVLKARITHFIAKSLHQLMTLPTSELISQRYGKYRAMGTYSLLNEAQREINIKKAIEASGIALADAAAKKKAAVAAVTLEKPCKLVEYLADLTINGALSRYRGLAPAICPLDPPQTCFDQVSTRGNVETAKTILDSQGPEAVARWVRAQKRVLITDTTMRDAHQSLLATRVRTEDIVKGAQYAHKLLQSVFSLEMWGGATFDVSMRFLDECPWTRLREIRAACPDICLQMLIRGSNAVGYTSYPDNVVAEFCRLAAENGIDVFRIFDCFNDIDSMKVSIDAVRAAGKIAEVCLCYTGNLLTSTVYDVDYYKGVVRQAIEAGAHMIAIKDMSGLLRPHEAEPLLKAIREVVPETMPVHFHTHSTSSGAIATCMEMAKHGCDIIDVCTASMADGTSQVSMNTFVAMMEGFPNATGINYLDLEPYDMYWASVRSMYSQFESGMLSGSARVFEHQIPGGQYSNLIVQCRSMGLWDRWAEVLDAYRDANRVLGDIIKVTPSSKCVGDLALYLVTRNLQPSDLLDASKASTIDFPESVVGLMRGDLGFPHRGFPEEIEKAVLRGVPKRTQRAGLTLPAVDFNQNVEQNLVGCNIADYTAGKYELGMSYLMYPKVFSDYIKSINSKGGVLLRYLPTPVYQHGMIPGQSFTMYVPSSAATEGDVPLLRAVNLSDQAKEGFVQVILRLERVGPLKNGTRELIFKVNGATQRAVVKDSTGGFTFDGPMADSKDPSQLASPMPGQIEKMMVSVGTNVSVGDTVCTVSAMKMEVKVTAPFNGKITSLSCEVGAKVVEGALLAIITPN